MTDHPRPSIEAIWHEAGGQIVGRDVYGWRKARCCLPGHDDQTASAQVNEETGRYRCFGCDVAGDQLDLLMRLHDIGFPEAVRRAAVLVGDGNGAVSEPANVGGGLLPGKSRSRQGRRNWVPPWKRG